MFYKSHLDEVCLTAPENISYLFTGLFVIIVMKTCCWWSPSLLLLRTECILRLILNISRRERSEFKRESHQERCFPYDCCCLVAKSCLFWDPLECKTARLLCPWASPGKNAGVGCHLLLQGTFLTRDRTWVSGVSCVGRWFLCPWATRETL